jgi:hypothetical protein
LSCSSHTRSDAVLFTAELTRGVNSRLVVVMLRRKLLCDVIAPPPARYINLKLDFNQESMAVQVCHALSKQVRKKNVNKIHSFPNNQQFMHDGEFLHTVMKMSRCMQFVD